jgi:DNA end-binding protein Ku
MGTLLRYPYEVRGEDEYFDDIQDVKVTKEMLDLAQHIVESKAAEFDPEKFEDRYETALVDLINQKRSSAVIKSHGKPRAGTNVVELVTALRQSLKGEGATPARKAKRPPKKVAGQKEMLLPISGKKEPAAAKKATARPASKRKAG